MVKFLARIHPGVAAAILLSIHAGLLIGISFRTFITVDEVMNVAAGLSYWRTGNFSIYRVNPPLTKLLAVVPILVMGREVRTDFHGLDDVPGERIELAAGEAFARLNEASLFDLVQACRWAGIAWSVLGGWLIYRCSNRIFGGSAGLLGLSLWAFEPYVLGHAALVTSDVPAAVAGLLASIGLCRYLKNPSRISAGIAGGLLGLAVLTKFTLLGLFVAWPLLAAVAVRIDSRATGRPGPSYLAGMAIIFVSGLLVINLGYLFRGSLRPLGDYVFVSKLLTGGSAQGMAITPANRFRDSWLDAIPVPLPEDLVRGIDTQRVDFEGVRRSYLRGIGRYKGWWYFYIYAWSVKLPIGTAILLGWGVIDSLLRRGPSAIVRLVLLGTALALAILVSSQTGYTQHSRYLLPALPPLMIVAGSLVGSRERARPMAWRGLAWALLAASILSSLCVYPLSLSYFNEAAGGPRRGDDHLIDSNLDWGQDLIRLREWQELHGNCIPFYVYYYNLFINLDKFGVRHDPPPTMPGPGFYAVSVNFLRGERFPICDGRKPLRESVPGEFDYLRAMTPIGYAGHSIRIFRVTQADLYGGAVPLPPHE